MTDTVHVTHLGMGGKKTDAWLADISIHVAQPIHSVSPFGNDFQTIRSIRPVGQSYFFPFFWRIWSYSFWLSQPCRFGRSVFVNPFNSFNSLLCRFNCFRLFSSSICPSILPSQVAKLNVVVCSWPDALRMFFINIKFHHATFFARGACNYLRKICLAMVKTYFFHDTMETHVLSVWKEKYTDNWVCRSFL